MKLQCEGILLNLASEQNARQNTQKLLKTYYMIFLSSRHVKEIRHFILEKVIYTLFLKSWSSSFYY